MKRITQILTLLAALLCAQSVQSQCYAKLKRGNRQFVRKHQLKLNAGIGLIPTFLLDKATVIKYPTTLGVDFFLSKNVSLGLFHGRSVQQFEKYYTQIDQRIRVKNDHRVSGGRLLVHLAKRSRWNVYGGFGVSRHDSKFDFGIEEINLPTALIATIRTRLRLEPEKSSYVFGGVVGGQYFFSKRFSINLEFGNNISLATFGGNYILLL